MQNWRTHILRLIEKTRLPARYKTLAGVFLLFLLLNGVVRGGLLIFDGDVANVAPSRLVGILATGLLYDSAAAAYLLVPFALLAFVWPNRAAARRGHACMASTLVFGLLPLLLCTGIAEALFWNEFSSRFNFIAVDYLIYTRETLGNIRESYPVGKLLAGVGALALLIFLAVRKPLWRVASADGGTWRQRAVASLLFALAPGAGFLLLGDAPRESLATASARELAGNGYYEFMRAFRSNDLDYSSFYRTVALSDAEQELWDEFAEAQSTSVFTHRGRHPLERSVEASGPARPLNVVLVSMESLGSDYVESFGGTRGLTPNLDCLGKAGLRFTQLYATGLRTVRGLEALTLSMPPTPGHAVPVRKNNKNFQTLGGVLQEHGYEPLYLYGGYGYFDNMTDFFSGNGYTVIDRTAIARENISHETIWGVADEDLFAQALREIDARAQAGKKVFAHVMTTSNHRPFTYPSGRIDLTSGSGREGAVKYSDWAIGRFMEEARHRPWFSDTIFVFVADHTSHGRGRTDLPPENYRIPLIIYSPAHIPPGAVDYVASQIDVAPTVLGLLNLDYTSRFFGQNILTEGKFHQRALMANYLTVGYMENGLIAELSPKRAAHVVDARTGAELASGDPRSQHLIQEAIGHYEVAAAVLKGGKEPARANRNVAFH